jgi:hypothetical protein
MLRARWPIFVFVACFCFPILLIGQTNCAAADEEKLPLVTDVEFQPLAAQVKRVAQALDLLGSPLTKAELETLDRACSATDPTAGVRGIQETLDPLCLAMVEINAESRVKVAAGPAPKKLMQQGWRVFLVKVQNEPSVHSAVRVGSPNAARLQISSSGSPEPKSTIKPEDVTNRWLDVSLADSQPLNKTLSGLKLEYRVIELHSRDAGRREAKLEFDVGQGTQDLGFRNEINVLFDCEPAVAVKLGVQDVDGSPTTAQFTIRDERGRIYPSRARRLAPDFFFHDQIYRRDGETISLPPGKYRVSYTRGPEYKTLEREITVPAAATHQENFRLERWIKLADHGWFSGDHHIHAAGCAHYESPTAGVTPQDMMRHIEGEDLNVGCVLSWGPCWYVQKQYFDGRVSKLSTASNVMRYDVEVSGFPSSHAGHICLLRLTEQDYPGTTRIEEWPSWDLPIFQWAKAQRAVVGFAHSGWGLKTNATKLPSYEMPPFDGIGANEYIVDVTHNTVDFISTVDTPPLWELNIWYHTLNCGFSTRVSGETDFPCIYGDRVGLGRSYVKVAADTGRGLSPFSQTEAKTADDHSAKKGTVPFASAAARTGAKPLDYDTWVQGIRDGRSYVSDGLSHLFDLTVNGLGVGEPAAAGSRPSVLPAKSGEKLTVKIRAAALLAEKPRDDIRRLPLDQKPYWHIERARVGDSRQVPVELIVNGQAVETKLLDADGRIQDVTFDYTPKISSWLAVRIFPAAHTNPVFVELDGQPIRASRKSADWCLSAVDVCWKSKSPQIRPAELEAAKAAYAKAREVYQSRLAESANDE